MNTINANEFIWLSVHGAPAFIKTLDWLRKVLEIECQSWNACYKRF